MDQTQKTPEIVVVGAGIGGLTTAALLARSGYRVRVLERAAHPGGRARSRIQDGYVLNLGAHALYRNGPAVAALAQLGIQPRGGTVGGSGSFIMHDAKLAPSPRSALTLLGTDVLSARGKFTLARIMFGLGERKLRSLRGLTVEQWLERETPEERTRAVLAMFIRLTCYAHAPATLSAQAAARQLGRAIKHGVMYVDGGWQSLLDAVVDRASSAGVQLELGVDAVGIEHADGVVTGVTTRDGRHFPAAAVVAALEPAALAGLLPGDAHAERWARASVPLRAACLDLGVASPLPHPERLNVQSIDAPLYFANHSAFAELAPPGAQVLHLIRYLAPGEDGRGTEPELRAFLERIQPGVYERADVKRFMPNLVVHNDLSGHDRARDHHPEIRGLFLVGDFAAGDAMLTDAVLSSASAAAARIREAWPAAQSSSNLVAPVVKVALTGDAGRAA